MIKNILYNTVEKLEKKTMEKLVKLLLYSKLTTNETIKEIHKMEKLGDKLIDLRILIDKKRFEKELIENMPDSIT